MDAEQLDALVRSCGGVITSAEALRAGLTQAGLEWALRKGRLRPLRRGVHTSARLWEEMSPTARHLLRILAQQRLHPDLVACATSAAVAHGLPLPFDLPHNPVLTVARDAREHGARGDRASALRRRARLTEAETEMLLNGVRVTTVQRTVLDCAREWDRPWGLAIADAAVQRKDVDPADLITAAGARAPAPGTQRARWAAAHTRGGVESPLESLARAVVVLAGLPEPTPQVWVTTNAGNYRVDLLDVDNQVIIEADGRLKYTTAEDLWREKRREDALRDSGFEVVRFTMPDYRRQSPWLISYRQALSRAAKRPNPG